MSDVSISVQKRGARNVAQIIRDGLINDREFRFNHIESVDYHWVIECNGFFPTKYGYSYNDSRSNYNGGGGHPDDQKSFFLWQEYDSYDSYPGHENDRTKQVDSNYRNPEWLTSHHELFIFDGTTNYWEGSVPKYGEKLSDWDDTNFFGDRLVPISVMGPDNETPTDRDRRYTYYRQTECIWGLLNCDCSSNGCPCHKVETEYYRNGGSCICGFPGHSHDWSDSEEEDQCDEDGYPIRSQGYSSSESYRIWSLGTNIDNTLGSRMARLGAEVSPVHC